MFLKVIFKYESSDGTKTFLKIKKKHRNESVQFIV